MTYLASVLGKVPEFSSVAWLSVFLGSSLAIALVWGVYEYVGLVRIRKANAKATVATVGGFGFAEALDPEFQKASGLKV